MFGPSLLLLLWIPIWMLRLISSRCLPGCSPSSLQCQCATWREDYVFTTELTHPIPGFTQDSINLQGQGLKPRQHGLQLPQLVLLSLSPQSHVLCLGSLKQFLLLLCVGAAMDKFYKSSVCVCIRVVAHPCECRSDIAWIQIGQPTLRRTGF